VTASERIRRTAHAVALAIGGNPLAYMAICAVVIHAHENVCELERWDLVRDDELWRAAHEGADELRENLERRTKRQVAA
jgi:hypothetical protein